MINSPSAFKALPYLKQAIDAFIAKQVEGVRRLDEYDPRFSVEITETGANIIMERGAVPQTQLIEALWVFDPEGVQKCHCRAFCRVVDGKHDGHHDHACG